MKSEIHPRYVTCTVPCGCGEKFVTRATQAAISIEICSKCHPFYTGKQKWVDTAGRIEKFSRKYNWTVGAKGGKAEAAPAKKA